MRNRRNYYRILQVQPDAPPQIIRASYRTLMGKLRQHPDLGGSPWKASLINEAYETLSDPGKRAEYDRQVLAGLLKSKAFSASKEKTRQPPPGKVEKRTLERITKMGKLTYIASGSRREKVGQVRDLSLKGIQFMAPDRLNRHSTFRVKNPLFQATARVTHCRRNTSAQGLNYLVGAEFIDIAFKESRGTFFSAKA